MKLALLTIALASIASGQWVYFHSMKPAIKQRYVPVYVIAPEGRYFVWEPAKD